MLVASFRANALLGDGITAATASYSVTIPSSAVIGDVALLAVGHGSTTITITTPTGWTLVSGPDVSSASAAYLFSKTLVSGDPGSSVAVTLSTTNRASGVLTVISGATTTGLLHNVAIGASGTTATLPTLASVPAGAYLHVAWCLRVAATTAPDVTVPSATYTEDAVNRAATNVTASNPNTSCEVAYLVAPSAGTYGGESSTTTTATSVNYLIAVPDSGGTPSVTLAHEPQGNRARFRASLW